MDRKDKLWVATFVVLATLFAANVFGTWPEAIDQNNYQGSWTQVGTDLAKLEVVLKGLVGDTNLTTGISGTKISDSTLSFSKNYYASAYFAGMPGDSSRKYAYGDVKICAPSNRIPPDSSFDVAVLFSDSSDVGNPAFAAAPYVVANFMYNKDTLTTYEGNTFVEIDTCDAFPIVLVRRAGGGATRCTLTVVNRYAASGTLWTKNASLVWQAMEDKDGR